MAGRKLRVMTVEKGLLRETKIIQKTIAALLECQVRLSTTTTTLHLAFRPLLT